MGADLGQTAETLDVGFHGQDLVDPDPVGVERDCGTSHIEPPDTRPRRADEVDCAGPVAFEVADPCVQCQGVVLT